MKIESLDKIFAVSNINGKNDICWFDSWKSPVKIYGLIKPEDS